MIEIVYHLFYLCGPPSYGKAIRSTYQGHIWLRRNIKIGEALRGCLDVGVFHSSSQQFYLIFRIKAENKIICRGIVTFSNTTFLSSEVTNLVTFPISGSCKPKN